VAGRELILDFSEYDPDRVIADLEEIRKHNRQRFEMEQLTAVVYTNLDRMICAGYKDITPNEFWIRGHMPEFALMPGVVMCEVAAQVSSYFAQRYSLLGCEVIGFGGMDEVRFRGIVVPGDRLVMVVQALKVRRGALIQCRFQGFVRQSLVVEGRIAGVSLTIGGSRSNSGNAGAPQQGASSVSE
jgi:3-hydroxyacyl-[acyl-carrier-protein] dehydratase